MALVNKKAALLVKDVDAREKLVKVTLDLISDFALQTELRTNISKLAFKDSARVIAMEVLKLAGHQ